MTRTMKREELRLPLGDVGVEVPVIQDQDAQSPDRLYPSDLSRGESNPQLVEPGPEDGPADAAGGDALLHLAFSLAAGGVSPAVRRTVSIPSDAVQALRVNAVVTGASPSSIAVEAVARHLEGLRRGNALAATLATKGRRKPRAVSRYSITAPGQWWRSLAVVAAATGITQNDLIAASIASQVPAAPKVR